MIVDYEPSHVNPATMGMMALFAKLWSLSWALRDGALDSSDRRTMLTDVQRDRAVTFLPNLLEFASYVNFFGTSIMGPFMEYKDYIRFIKLADHYKKMPSGRF